MSNTERQARLRRKREDAGLVQVTLWLPASAVADFQDAALTIRDNPDYTLGRLVSRSTGKLTGLAWGKIR